MPITISIDASVAIKTLVEENGSDRARAVVAAHDMIIVPAHAYAEISEILYRRTLSGVLDRLQAQKALQQLPIIYTLAPLDTVMAEAFEIACDLRHSVYDCLYVATAIRFATQLVTADLRLLRKTADTKYSAIVIDLESFSSSACKTVS
jgi:predicted nucleic acid-binding protein